MQRHGRGWRAAGPGARATWSGTLTNPGATAYRGGVETVNIYDAKTHLSRLLERVERGERIVIARAGTPVAMLVPFAPGPPEPRRIGLWHGQVRMSDDFDAPLPELEDAP